MNGKTEWVIGGERGCDLVVDLPSVSRRHCRLSQKLDGTFTLEDLGSTNGTFVNGRRLLAETPVRRGDVVTLGLTVPMPWPETAAAPIVPAQNEPKVVRVGREPDNDLVLDRPEVSGHHARVVIAPDGKQGVVDDLGSTNGTSVNAPQQRVSHAVIAPGDVIYFGPVAVPAATFFSGESAQRSVALPELIVRGEAMVVGRDPACDLVLNVPVVSSRHARFTHERGVIKVEDLGSSNGTFINGRRITDRQTVSPGDLIRFGDHETRLVDKSPSVVTVGPYLTVTAASVAFMLQNSLLGGWISGEAGSSEDVAWFELALAAFWIGLTMGLLERFIVAKSRSEGDSNPAVLWRSVARTAAIDLAWCGLILGMVAWRAKIGVRPEAVGVLWLTALIGSALGEALVRWTGRLTYALASAAGLIVVVGVLSWPTQGRPDFGRAGRLAAGVSPVRWSFEALLLLSAGEKADDPAVDPVERYFPAETDRAGSLACATALLAMLGGLVYLVAVTARPEADRWRPAVPASH